MADTQPKTGGAGSGAKAPPASTVPPSGATGSGRAPKVTPLVFKRQSYMNSIKRAEETYRTNGLEGVSLAQAKHLQQQLDEQITRCRQAHEDLVTSGELTETHFGEYERQYVANCICADHAVAMLIEHIERLTPAPVVATVEPTPIHVELKAADLQASHPTWGKFDGNLLHWQSFKDRFVAAVHENENIRPVFKLQHLLTALTGRAASVIGTRQSTEQGYKGAWERLCEVYDDPYLIVRAVMKTLHSMTALERATYDGLRKLIDTTHEALRQLRELKLPVEHWDQVLVYMLVERLDNQTADAWEMTRAAGMPTLAGLSLFLDKRAQSLAHLNPPEAERMGQAGKHGRNENKRRHPETKPAQNEARPAKRDPEPAADARKANEVKKPFPCPQCQGKHPLFYCPELAGLNLAGRKEAIRNLKRCLNCLRAHAPDRCSLGPCPKCPT